MRHLKLFAACLIAGSILANPTNLVAQATVRGMVINDHLETPIPGATVTLTDAHGRRLRQTVANEVGTFWFPISPSGSYKLHVQQLGFLPVTTPTLRTSTFRVTQRDTLEVQIRLHETAILIAPLEVIVSDRRNPIMEGFYHRVKNGFGQYITREDVERRSASSVTDVLLTVPGIRQLTTGRGTRRTLVMSRALAQSGGGCPIQFYVDGILMNRASPGIMVTLQDESKGIIPLSDDDFSVDDIISTSDIEGIEIYKGLAGVPATFLNGDARCGVIAIWTKRNE